MPTLGALKLGRQGLYFTLASLRMDMARFMVEVFAALMVRSPGGSIRAVNAVRPVCERDALLEQT